LKLIVGAVDADCVDGVTVRKARVGVKYIYTQMMPRLILNPCKLHNTVFPYGMLLLRENQTLLFNLFRLISMTLHNDMNIDHQILTAKR